MSSPSNNQCLCKEDGFGISRTLCPVHGPVASNNLKEQVEEIITKHRLILSEAIPVDKATTQILNLILDTILAKPEMQLEDSVEQYNNLHPDTRLNVSLDEFREDTDEINAKLAQIRVMLEGMR